jgi:quercetin dioxygenase-like cupin family protein
MVKWNMVGPVSRFYFDPALLADLLGRAGDRPAWPVRSAGRPQPGPIGQCQTGSDGVDEHRSGVRLLHEADYEVWLLCWPPGSRVTPHDHGESSGAFTLVSGCLTEIRWHGGVREERPLSAGEVIDIPRGVVHDVVATAGPAFSLHVYAPPLTTMSFYDQDGRRVVRTEAVADAEPGITGPVGVGPS